ncbi:hypothetical protein C8K36_102194 [Rhodococcus sp. OK519]|nr:hypothetical protein C8K36_102194 [Rhodococcus sp. OK519]
MAGLVNGNDLLRPVAEAARGVAAVMNAAQATLVKRSCSALSVVMLCVAGLLVAASGSSGAAPPPGWRYTMVAFSNTSDSEMDVFESRDGTEFQLIQASAYRRPSGLVRDPSIFRNIDGLYYITYTTGGGTSIGFARSSDRINWTHMGDLPVPFCCALMPGTGDGTGSASLQGSSDFLGSSGSAGSSDGPSLSPFVTKAWAPEWFVAISV